jgi:selenide,water dikinase
VDDTEPKYGLCAIGEVHPDRMVRHSTACPGDLLILTKPIGTGIIATALKREPRRRMRWRPPSHP